MGLQTRNPDCIVQDIATVIDTDDTVIILSPPGMAKTGAVAEAA